MACTRSPATDLSTEVTVEEYPPPMDLYTSQTDLISAKEVAAENDIIANIITAVQVFACFIISRFVLIYLDLYIQKE